MTSESHRVPAPKFFGISTLQLDSNDSSWLAGAGAELLEQAHGGHAGEREALAPQITLALVRTFLRRSAKDFRRAAEGPQADLERIARDSWGFCARRPALLAELLRLERRDLAAERSAQAVISVWTVPEPASDRYVTSDGITLRLLGALWIARDIDGACRICGETLPGRRWRHERGAKPHTTRTHHCATCHSVRRENSALQVVFDDLRLALHPPTRPSLTYEQIEVSVSRPAPAAGPGWPREKRAAWLERRANSCP